jgi:hypothetical protein
MLSSADPHGRAAHIACGAALFNLRVAAAAAGLRPDIRLLPDPGQPLLLAEIRLTGRHQATSWERELKAAIPRRQTNQKPFSSRVVPPGIRAELGEAASLEGAALHFLDHGEAVRVLGLAAAAERDMLADPAYRAELARWVGDQPDRGGIPDGALGPRSLEGGARSATLHRKSTQALRGMPGLRSIRSWPCSRCASAVRATGWPPGRPCSGSG